MNIIDFLKERKRNEIFCKGCELYDRHKRLPCIYYIDKTHRCPKDEERRRFRGLKDDNDKHSN